MFSKYNVKVIGVEDEIKGYVFRNERWDEVIKLSLTQWGWSVAMSACLPVQISQAKDFLECYNRTFDMLEKIKSQNNIRSVNL